MRRGRNGRRRTRFSLLHNEVQRAQNAVSCWRRTVHWRSVWDPRSLAPSMGRPVQVGVTRPPLRPDDRARQRAGLFSRGAMDLGAPFDSLEELADGSRASLDGDSASVASLDRPAAPSPVEMRRDRIAADDAASPTQPPAAGGGGAVALRRQTHDRRRAVGKPPPEERTGFARIYFENQNFTSSTVFKLYGNTTVLEVRKSMANKIKIPLSDFEYYVIVVVFPTDSSLSARTLRDDEMILPLMDTLNRQRSATEADGSSRSHPRHQSRPPVKFVLKDVRGTPIDLDQSPATPVSALSPSPRRVPSDSQALTFPVLLGKGVHSGYLQKASLKDPNVWRKRWFIVKGDQLLYCKSSADQRDVTAISLLNAYLAKARPEVRVPYSFELRTPRRTFQLCANSKDEMVAWIHALHVQIGISSENHRLYEAEILITEDAVSRSEGEIYLSMHAEPSLLQRVLAREDTLKLFRDFVYTSHYQSLLDTWIECELYRRSSLARENGVVMGGSMGGRRSSKDEWDHLKEIIRAVQMLNVIQIDEMTQLRQSFQSEQISRRLSIALHADSTDEYPPGDILLPVQQKLFQALEAGPFQQFLLQNGYRLLLERTIGRIA